MPTAIIDPNPVIGPGPCDDCPHANECRSALLACAAFVRFVKEDSWRAEQRQPVRRWFEFLFGQLPPQTEEERKRRAINEASRRWRAKRKH